MYTSNQVKHTFRHIRQPLERFLDLRDTSETIIDSLKASEVKKISVSDIQRASIFYSDYTLPNGLTGIVPIQTVYLGRELFAFEANVGGDDEEAEDIVIEREQVNSRTQISFNLDG